MPFQTQNRPAADFASLAANPDVRAIDGDFNGDGTTDLALINSGSGWNSVPVALSSADAFSVQNRLTPDFASLAATPEVEAVTGDFNGDGTDDIALVNHSGGWSTIPVALSTATGFTVENRSAPDFASWAATPEVEAVAGDFNGDGADDIALVNHSGGWSTIPVALSTATGFTVENRSAPDFAKLAASPDVQVVAGDYNGDGRSDLALLNEIPGWNTIPVALSFTDSFTVENRSAPDFANLAASPNVTAVSGDFDGDGIDDLALVNQAAGWSTVPEALSSPSGFTVANPAAPDFASWAASTSVQPLSGDFNGDGTTDLALVNQAAGWGSVPVALSIA